MLTMTSGSEDAFIKLTRHYRYQLDNKNRLIYDLLCRQRVYLRRLRDFICRIPDELQRQAPEKLMESLEHLELNFNESQEEFYHLQRVIKDLEPGPEFDFEDFPGSPPIAASTGSAASFDLPSTTSSCSSSSCPAPRKRSRKASGGGDEPSSTVMETTTPVSASAATKRKRRRGSRAEDVLGRNCRATASNGILKNFVPRPCSSSSENANSPPSPMSTSHAERSNSSSNSTGSGITSDQWPPKHQNAPSSLSQLGTIPKSMAMDLELCTNEEDNILPDFSLFG